MSCTQMPLTCLVTVILLAIHCTNGQLLNMPPVQGGPRMIRPQPVPMTQMMNSMLQRNSRQQPACQINVQNCGIRSQSAMPLESPEPGLRYATPVDVPWHVAIRVQASSTSKPWFCSGAIINENWILCPAYCLYHKRPGDLATKSITIAAGITNPFTNSTSFTAITSYSIHASYTGSKSNGFDIALVKSSIEFPLSVNGPINAVCLPEGASNELEIGPIKCSGWPGMGIDNLVVTSSISDSIDRCVGVNTHDLPHELCSMSQSPPDCQLDGGSPCFRTLNSALPAVPTNNPAVLVGILSKKVTCRKPNSNSFATSRMTRVSFYNEWIAETMDICPEARSSGSNRTPNALTVSRGKDRDSPETTTERSFSG